MIKTTVQDNNRIFDHIIQTIMLFLIGGLVYTLIEKVFRGYSHFSMFILGGIDFILIGLLNEFIHHRINILFQSLIGSAIITVSELITGYIVNIRLGLNVWDYSNLPFNFWGQICIYYSLLWIPVSLVAVIADDVIRKILFGESIPAYF